MKRFGLGRRTPVELSLISPPILCATWFGCGWLPRMPGTWGALAALPVAWALVSLGGPLLLLLAAAAVFLLGLWAADRYMDAVDLHDPSAVVVDEVAGQWLTLVLVPPDVLVYLMGFLLFRAFDIMKPWPVNWLDRRVGGAIGVMIDDLVAALYALLALYLVVDLTGLGG